MEIILLIQNIHNYICPSKIIEKEKEKRVNSNIEFISAQ